MHKLCLFRLLVVVGLVSVCPVRAIDFVRDKDGNPIIPDWCVQSFLKQGREKSKPSSLIPKSHQPPSLLPQLEVGRAWLARTDETFQHAKAQLRRLHNDWVELELVTLESWRDLDVFEILEEGIQKVDPDFELDPTDPVGDLQQWIAGRPAVIEIQMLDEYHENQLAPFAGAVRVLFTESENTYFLIRSPDENPVTEVFGESGGLTSLND
ncbi:MAG: hypothetical protein H6617_11690 [Bdellovibrionaceae bacterium]|nr:hypothetical protein [Bdellovibrionales bacterium]MCB9255334.1 hypothetical protein [Pseudobdellovibrionaceae bacterium]